MSVPRCTARLLTRLAPSGRAEDVLGDLEEAHRRRLQHHRPWIAAILTQLEALDVAFALLRGRAARRSRFGNDQRMEARPVAIRRWGPGVSWLDFKLGFRMLLRYPGLTVVGGLAIGFGVSVGAGTFEFADQVLSPTLPLDGGDRIVAIRIRDRQTAGLEPRALYDFMTWRDELSSVADLGAYRLLRRSLITGEGDGEPISVAEISASGFRVARTPPLMGRTLDATDERPGAPPVAVVGYHVWQTRLGGDPTVVG